MVEESKQAFDPEATIAQPVKAAGDATDPEATISQPLKRDDPEATVTGPALKIDPGATDRMPAFDPDATDRHLAFDPESTVLRPASVDKSRKNPFAPKSPPETIQANLSSLGGVNPLVAMANPILAAVPQIRRTLRHPDPAALLGILKDQIDSLETSAISAEIADDALSAAVYALCALLDESAATTPWGQQWIEQGLLQALRGESGGAEGFFTKLDQISAEPEKNADLLEFYYVCLALGFEGRYRNAEDGKQELRQVRDRLYALVSCRRPRPEALSAHWRTPSAQAAADAALKTAARANAARAAAAAVQPAAAAAPSRYALSRWPRRAIWSAVAGIVGASVVLYLLGLRLLDDETRDATAPVKARLALKGSAIVQAPATAPAPAAPSTAEALTAALGKLPVSISEGKAGITLRLMDDKQFVPGSIQPAVQTRALLVRVAEALDKLPGTIVVIGHADATPSGTHYASNAELSMARARSAVRTMAPKLADAKRLSAEGKGDAEPIASNDNDADRAKNRRVSILLKARP